MIPKIIHYCWFGGNPLPKLAKKCIKSWKKYCKGYEIREWNEQTFDIASAPLYVRQAYEAKKWAFVTDYVRLQVVYEHGGIYLDTDVELLRSPYDLLDNHAYFGFENGIYIATGLGFGAEKGTPILQELMADYDGIPFLLEDGSYDQKSCPVRNTEVFLRWGLRQDNSEQMLAGKVRILPSSWLCPLNYWAGVGEVKNHTLSIHHFSGSWTTKEMQEERIKRIRERKKAERREFWRYLPNRILLKIIGEKAYDKIRSRCK